MPRIRLRSLPVQLLITQVGLVILTAIAIGLPGIAFLRGQVDRHTLDLLDQGSRTTQALVADQRLDLKNLALLTAQRPTLHQLIEAGDPEPLSEYLGVLRAGADLDLILVCGPDGQPLATDGHPIEPHACGSLDESGVFPSNETGVITGWLLAEQPIEQSPGGLRVVTGRALDASYARGLHDWVGLDVAVFLSQQFLASSFASSPTLEWNELPAGLESRTISLNGEPLYARSQTVAGGPLQVVLFYPAEQILRAQRELTLRAGLGILLVILAGSGLGVWRSRQLSQSLKKLRQAAGRLRQGDLTTPIAVQTRIPEVTQIARTLEAARSALRNSLTQLGQEKAWVEHLLEAVVEGFLTLDRHGRITFFSRGAEQIMGWRAEQVLGQSLDEIFRLEEEGTRFSQLIPPPGSQQKIIVRRADNRPMTLAVTGARLAPPQAGRASAVLMLRDISDEEALRRLLGEFLANIAHEFRTPLSALAASIELLHDQLPDLSPEDLSELVNSVHLGVLSLQTLIDNLLEGASIETGRFRVFPRPAGVGDVIDEAIQTMAPLAAKYGQIIQVDLPTGLPDVQADPRRTVQVLVNLLSNAIKWSSEGSILTVTAACEGQSVQISVADQGPGIPSARPQELFLRFDRTQVREGRADSGAGLGLSVVKAIVEAQGGQVGAKNREEGGAVFWFTLPVLERPPVVEESAV